MSTQKLHNLMLSSSAPGCVPAERHAPDHRHPGADAAAGGRGGAGVGRGVEHRHAGLLLHQPHHAARGAGEVARGTHGGAAAAPHAGQARETLNP
jgi:hypothetical protein